MATIDPQYRYALQESARLFKRWIEVDAMTAESWEQYDKEERQIANAISDPDARDFAIDILAILKINLEAWWVRHGATVPDYDPAEFADDPPSSGIVF